MMSKSIISFILQFLIKLVNHLVIRWLTLSPLFYFLVHFNFLLDRLIGLQNYFFFFMLLPYIIQLKFLFYFCLSILTVNSLTYNNFIYKIYLNRFLFYLIFILINSLFFLSSILIIVMSKSNMLKSFHSLILYFLLSFLIC